MRPPHSGHTASTYQIWDPNPGFLTSLTVHLTLCWTTLSSRGQQAFSPRQKPQFQTPETRGDCHFPVQSLPTAHPLPTGQQLGSLTCHLRLPQIWPLFCCSPEVTILPLRFSAPSMHSSACSPGLKLFSLSNAPTAPSCL